MKSLLFLFALSLTLSSCNKDDDTKRLPPATQTGAGTFACYVNGKPFVDTSGGYFNCFYQLVDGEYYFSISGNDDDINPISISLGTRKKTISEGETLELSDDMDGNALGGAFFKTTPTDGLSSSTNSLHVGQLTITKLDFENHIVSGIFSFDVKHPLTNETIQIRDGRFDTLFTQ